jgi:hypothetical protein
MKVRTQTPQCDYEMDADEIDLNIYNYIRYIYIYIILYIYTYTYYMNRCCSMGAHDTKSWDGTHVGWSFTLIVAIWRFPTMVVPQKWMVCNGKSYLIGRLVATPEESTIFLGNGDTAENSSRSTESELRSQWNSSAGTWVVDRLASA